MTPSRLMAAAAVTAGLVLALPPAAEAKTSRPYEAIAGHYPTMKQANAVAARARSKGFTVVVQPNRPGHIEVEYGNGWSTPGPAVALCAKVKAKGLPCQVGQEYHGVPKEWSSK
ncbi:MAG TPA: hypothetical protein VGP90_03170 [Acidimicrobiia bacterium]|nr:hypothetical protein [Acidimicrobiia bacterium]